MPQDRRAVFVVQCHLQVIYNGLQCLILLTFILGNNQFLDILDCLPLVNSSPSFYVFMFMGSRIFFWALFIAIYSNAWMIFPYHTISLLYIVILLTLGIEATKTYNVTGIFPISDPSINGVGLLEANSFLCAIKSINSNPTLLPSITLNPIVIDSGSHTITKDFDIASIGKGSLAIIGPSNEFQLLQTATVVMGEQTALIGYGLDSEVGDATLAVRGQPILRLYTNPVTQANAIYDTCLLFDWKVIAAIFSYSSYGLVGEALSIAIGQNRANINIECSMIVDGTSIMDYDALSNFSQCVSNKNIKVILIWSDAVVASQAISKIHEQKGNEDCVFLATAQWAVSADLNQLSNPQPANDYPPFPISYLQGIHF